MRLINETDWRTADLRRFILAGIRAMGAEENKIVTVKYSRSARNLHGGWAFLGRDTQGAGFLQGRRMMLSLPSDPAKLDLADFARTVEHEVGHQLGLRHKDMSEEMRYCGSIIDGKHVKPSLPRWAEGLTVAFDSPVSPSDPMPAPESEETRFATRAAKMASLIDARARHADEMLAQAERRFKIAQRVLRKWRQKARYYEGKRAAASKHATGEEVPHA